MWCCQFINAVKQEIVIAREWQPVALNVKFSFQTFPYPVEQTTVLRTDTNNAVQAHQKFTPRRGNPILRPVCPGFNEAPEVPMG